MYSVLKVQISDNHITSKILEKSNFRLSAYNCYLGYCRKKFHRKFCLHVGKHFFNLCERRCFSVKVDAKQLAELRKQTGYSLSLCRDALLENNNDIKVAQAWLDEEAIKKGWQKAEKLQGRKTSEGLIGVMVENNHAAMVEVYV